MNRRTKGVRREREGGKNRVRSEEGRDEEEMSVSNV